MTGLRRRRRLKILLTGELALSEHLKPAWMQRLIFIILIPLLLGISIAGFGWLWVAGVFAYLGSDLPDISNVPIRLAQITHIYDRSGNLLYSYVPEEKRFYISISSLPDHVLAAFLAAEDKRFFQHEGVDYQAMLRALIANIRANEYVQGGSTITQQLARNLFLGPERSISRKIKEVILARELEKNLSKQEILELYLNKIPFGANSYGIEAASLTYFGKRASELSIAQAATLASIPRAPSMLSPFRAPEKLLERRNRILELMYTNGFITKEHYNKAQTEQLALNDSGPLNKSLNAPHFVFYVIDTLEKWFGKDALSEGLEVYTTLDNELQLAAEKMLREYVVEKGREFNANNAALVLLNGQTGEILAMAGSYDFFDPTYGQFNAALAQRQPGSTLKPFIYSLAFERLGYSKNTRLRDVYTNINGYAPRNFTGAYHGIVSLERALLESLNVPAVRTLNALGTDPFREVMARCGVKLDPKAGISMAIGGASTSLLDLTGAYTAFSHEGKCFEPIAVKKVERSSGEILFELDLFETLARQKQIFQPETIDSMNYLLRKVKYHFAAFFKLKEGRFAKLAAKTGTSDGPRDAWTIGHSLDYVLGVWLGNHDNSPLSMTEVSLKLAVPLWERYFKLVLERRDQSVKREDPAPEL